MRVKHTLDIFIDAYSKILILGSFPSIRSREQGFYYMHPQNRFYKVLSKIFDEEISSDIDDRKSFLSTHHIALYDVIEECNINNSDDNSIRDVILFDIESTLKKYSNIKVIGITGK